ncbi:MAG TPA: chaperonin GroEL [Candidatus Sulfotelmatobacter sp.]|nr:chaperonin GroEL [Candidatus Sulfotelmatobacter sp.]
MGKQMQFDDQAREALRRGVDQLAGAVRVTLGPRGRNVVIDRGAGAPTITNDGLAISREIELADRFENMGAQLAREVAIKTGEVAGDGTTTATVLAQELVSRGLRATAAGHNPVALKRGIDRAVAAVVEALHAMARPIEGREDVERVARVSAGDDAALGALVAQAMDRVGRRGVVTVEDGRGMDTTLEVVEGVRFDRGYLSPYFVTDPENMEATLETPLVVLTEFKLSAVRDLLGVLDLAAQAGRPLLLVADDVEGEALAMLVVNRLRGTLASIAVKAPESGDRRREALEDLGLLTGATLFAPDLGRTLEAFTAADFGRAVKVIVDREHTTLVQGGGRASGVQQQLVRLEKEMERATTDFDRDRLRRRIARLSGGVAVIRVGAATEVELRERRSRLEDALAATRAAVEEGVVPGGGVALLRCQPVVRRLELAGDEAVGRDIVAHALEAPARQIAANAGAEPEVVVARLREAGNGIGFNALTGRYEDLEAAGILDPAMVTRCALQNAASIGALVLTTDAIVVEEENDEPPAPEGA